MNHFLFSTKTLLNEGIKEDDIFVRRPDKPSIQYRDDAHCEHMYFPDIYVKSENKVIEVKSDYTLLREIEKNQWKWDSTVCVGYALEVRVYNGKGILLEKHRWEYQQKIVNVFSCVSCPKLKNL